MPTSLTLTAPEGFVISRAESTATPGQIERDTTTAWNELSIGQRYQSLKEWADSNSLQLRAEGWDLLAYSNYMDIFYWTLFEFRTTDSPANEQLFNAYACPGCESEIAVGQPFCGTCMLITACRTCRISGARLFTATPGDGQGFCTNCCNECETDGCQTFLPSGDFTKCATCEPRAACAGCQTILQASNLVERDDRAYCDTCIGLFCDHCNTFQKSTKDTSIDGQALHICSKCAQKVYDEQRAKLEIWSDEHMPVSGNLVIPSSDIRPVRTISIETEFDGQGQRAGDALHSQGLLEGPGIGNYSTQEGNGRRTPCILKRDGTVSGGELVTYLIDLDNENHAAALLRMTEVMKGLRDIGQATFSSNAGGHIHIDLHGFTYRDLWVKYTLFKFLEAPLYYMGGAGATYGHRSLKGSGYSNPPKGGPYGTVAKFVQGARGFGRSGLNLSNWFHALNNCACGSTSIGELGSCQCNLGKATAEWRLWNAEITPRILHGWIALMQALTAHAQNMEGFDESTYPQLEWTRQHFRQTDQEFKDSIKARLEWMHRELPLTIHERDSLIYVAKRSELKELGDTYLDSLIEIENNGGLTKKAAPNPNSRKTAKFEITTATKIAA